MSTSGLFSPIWNVSDSRRGKKLSEILKKKKQKKESLDLNNSQIKGYNKIHFQLINIYEMKRSKQQLKGK